MILELILIDVKKEETFEEGEENMLNYTEKEMKEIIENILGKEILNIKPVGNHHLKRHLVYGIKTHEGDELVFKMYYVNGRRSREVASLTLLEEGSVLSPKLIDYGTLENDIEWILMERIEGVTLDSVMHMLDEKTKRKIFNDMGKQLGELHRTKEYEKFGDFDIEGNVVNGYKTYKEKFSISCNNIEKDILEQELPEKDILIDGLKALKEDIHNIEFDEKGSMTHGDYDGRNILVHEIDGEWKISGIIDFEICYASVRDRDMLALYEKYFLENKELEESFYEGYERYFKISNKFKDSLDYLLLSSGLGICSWAYKQAPDYYPEGVKLVKRYLEIMK
ncbi:phosphotransferase family protein [Oceanirhabdus seepicola]|uniref:Phosphotransferase n=1 Tax=Oceanirhabdus seepicola TaxID=2828781 RepID=A0A9J6NZV1_9CLOT|nr:phosphotransferase [Oceanirhabdus seepicola]MCM1989141.1 phosphotransferase [Oceanirhabdus seepicola]